MDHNPWYFSLTQSVVCHSKSLFFQYIIPVWFKNVVVWICINHFYTNIFYHFICNQLKIRFHVQCIQPNILLCYNVSLLNQTPCITIILFCWQVRLILETVCLCQKKLSNTCLLINIMSMHSINSWLFSISSLSI